MTTCYNIKYNLKCYTSIYFLAHTHTHTHAHTDTHTSQEICNSHFVRSKLGFVHAVARLEQTNEFLVDLHTRIRVATWKEDSAVNSLHTLLLRPRPPSPHLPLLCSFHLVLATSCAVHSLHILSLSPLPLPPNPHTHLPLLLYVLFTLFIYFKALLPPCCVHFILL